MRRSVFLTILAVALLASVITSLFVFIIDPSSFLFRILLSTAVLIGMIWFAIILISFRNFFGERRETGKRLIYEVRTHRAETRLLRSELSEVSESLSRLIRGNTSEIQETLQAFQRPKWSKVQELVSDATTQTKRDRESLSRLIRENTSEIQESLKTLRGPEWSKVEELVSGVIAQTKRDWESESSGVAEQLTQKVAALADQVIEIERMLSSIENGQRSLVPAVTSHYAVRTKQLASLLEAQRQDLASLRLKNEQPSKS